MSGFRQNEIVLCFDLLRNVAAQSQSSVGCLLLFLLFWLSFSQEICCLSDQPQYLARHANETRLAFLSAATKSCQVMNKQQIPCGNDSQKSKSKNRKSNSKTGSSALHRSDFTRGDAVPPHPLAAVHRHSS